MLKSLTKRIIFSLAGLMILFFALQALRIRYALYQQLPQLSAGLEKAELRMTEAAADAEADWQTYDDFIKGKVDTIAYLLDTSAPARDSFDSLLSEWGLCRAFLTDSDGNVSFSWGANVGRLRDAGLERFVLYMQGDDDHVYKTVDDVCYYISPRADGSFLIGGVEAAEMIASQDARKEAGFALQKLRIGEAGFVLAVRMEDNAAMDNAGDSAKESSAMDNVVAFTKDQSLIGQDFSALCSDPLPEDGARGWLTLSGEAYYGLAKDVKIEKTDYRLIAVVSQNELLASTDLMFYGCLAAYILTALLISWYSLRFQKRCAAVRISTPNECDSKAENAPDPTSLVGSADTASTETAMTKKQKRLLLCRLLSLRLAGFVCLLLLGCYLQNLSNAARLQRIEALQQTEADEMVTANQQRTEELTSRFHSEYVGRAKHLAWTFSMDPSLVNDEALKQLAETTGLAQIFIYDACGQVVATNTNYGDLLLPSDEYVEEVDPYAEFWEVIRGHKDSLIVPANEKDKKDMDILEYVAAARQDNVGMVQIALRSEQLARQLSSIGEAAEVRAKSADKGGQPQHPLLQSLLSKKWERSLNLFSLSYSLLCLLRNLTTALLFSWLMLLCTRAFGRRIRALGHFLSGLSFVIALLLSGFTALYNFGIDKRALQVLAGILLLIVGFGAHAVFADLFAGVCLRLEGMLRPGDNVNINGLQGRLTEIGLRCTRIENTKTEEIYCVRNEAIREYCRKHR